ncbi:MAG: hypothetical protein L0312_13060, partial [Acidobacteria bacterium]|nr:hypothetical protein [Acidobacteriota bacterium]
TNCTGSCSWKIYVKGGIVTWETQQTDYAFAGNAFLLAYALMYAGSGLILDRVGSRKGLAIFVALWSVASGLHAAIRGFVGLGSDLSVPSWAC